MAKPARNIDIDEVTLGGDQPRSRPVGASTAESHPGGAIPRLSPAGFVRVLRSQWLRPVWVLLALALGAIVLTGLALWAAGALFFGLLRSLAGGDAARWGHAPLTRGAGRHP